LRFSSTHHDGAAQEVSLDDYIGRMKEGQDKIYYVTADSWEAASNSPHLEIFRKKGLEVLLMSDRVDEWMMSYLRDYEEKAFTSIAKGGLDLEELADEEEKKHQAEVAENLKPLVERLKETLDDRVKEVRVTGRLVDWSACVVVDERELSPHMVRMLEAAGQTALQVKRILDINPDHAFIARVQEASDNEFADWAEVLLDQALLSEGASLKDPA